MQPKLVPSEIGSLDRPAAMLTKRLKVQLARLLRHEGSSRLMIAAKAQRKPASAFFFTTYKCASSFQGKLLKAIHHNTPLDHIDYFGSLWKLGNRIALDPGPEYEIYLQSKYDRLYRLHGEIYGPQRAPFDFPGLDRFKAIFFLRDPRDVLVSAYYSFGYTHTTPNNEASVREFLEERERIQQETIDQFALRQAAGWITPHYNAYAGLRERCERQLFLSYDSYVVDRRRFIEQVCEFLDVTLPEPAINKLVATTSPIVPGAPKMAHRRSGRSRQWETELQPATVSVLNDELKPVLDFWGFQ